MSLKSRIEELISSVHNSTTYDGVKEIEDLYTRKKKELGAAITPMMDIRVRDCIRGKIESFESLKKEREEASAAKEMQRQADELASKMDEGLHVVEEREFFNHETRLHECSIDAAVLMHLSGDIPTAGHKELIKVLEDAAHHVGGQSRLFASTKSLSLTESFSGEETDVENINNLYREVDELISHGVTRLFAMVEEENVAMFRRLGKHFLREGGYRFEIVKVKNKVKTSDLMECVTSDDFDKYAELSGVSLAESEEGFNNHLETLL